MHACIVSMFTSLISFRNMTALLIMCTPEMITLWRAIAREETYVFRLVYIHISRVCSSGVAAVLLAFLPPHLLVVLLCCCRYCCCDEEGGCILFNCCSNVATASMKALITENRTQCIYKYGFVTSEYHTVDYVHLCMHAPHPRTTSHTGNN